MRKHPVILFTGNLRQDLPVMRAMVAAGIKNGNKKNYFDDELPRLERRLWDAVKKKGGITMENSKHFMTKKLDEIYNHFGKESQIKQLEEECSEFIESRTHDEIADVFVVSAQLVLNNPEIMKIVGSKIDRTLERIKSGFYEQWKDAKSPVQKIDLVSCPTCHNQMHARSYRPTGDAWETRWACELGHVFIEIKNK